MVAPIILDLCGGTGSWSKPYVDAGYDVRVIDTLNQQDVRTYIAPPNVHGVLAAPPCTVFAGSGARWWADRHPSDLTEGIKVVYACLEIIWLAQPIWWALENPVGRLPRYIGPWEYTYQPWQYGDPYTKRTCIWGKHTKPLKDPVEPTEGSKMHLLPPSPERARLRSITPSGYAKQFFLANP